MKLDTKNWQPFKVGELFYKLENGKANQTMLEEGEDCFYVGAKRSENGVMFRCAYDESLVQKGNCIIFICNGEGSVGYANYMSMDFIGTTDIVAGYNKNLNEYTGPFIATVASLERPKFSYGRKWKKFLKNTELYLPVDSSGTPDWQFMEDYMKSLHSKKLTTYNKKENAIKIADIQRTEFVLAEIVDIEYGNKFDNDKMTYNNPSVNFVGRSSMNNGVNDYVDFVHNVVPYKAGCMTIALGGSIGSCFIQESDFYTAQNVAVLHTEHLSVHAKLFLATTIMEECRVKYHAFGRELNRYIKRSFTVGLPSTPEGEPDWQFMEDYIKSLPYGDRI